MRDSRRLGIIPSLASSYGKAIINEMSFLPNCDHILDTQILLSLFIFIVAVLVCNNNTHHSTPLAIRATHIIFFATGLGWRRDAPYPLFSQKKEADVC